MSFNKETAAAAGRKGGKNRGKGKDPKTLRNKSFFISVTSSEFEDITSKAALMGLSRVELIVRAVKAYGDIESK